MPTLTRDRVTLKVNLPSSTDSDPAWVEIYQSLLTADVVKFSESDARDQVTLQAFASLIKDWNFTLPDGSKAPITPENVGLLDVKDLAAITEKVEAFKKPALSTLKKNS